MGSACLSSRSLHLPSFVKVGGLDCEKDIYECSEWGLIAGLGGVGLTINNKSRKLTYYFFDVFGKVFCVFNDDPEQDRSFVFAPSFLGRLRG